MLALQNLIPSYDLTRLAVNDIYFGDKGVYFLILFIFIFMFLTKIYNDRRIFAFLFRKLLGINDLRGPAALTCWLSAT